jgi:hypothetical protein
MPEQFDPYYLWLGIPPAEQPPNHYRLLGLRLFEDNAEVISYAVDQRATHLRSFQSGKRSADSQRLLNEVAAAGVCLLDPAKRLPYDKQLRAKIDAEKPPAQAPPPAPAAGAAAPPPRTPRIPVARPLAAEPEVSPETPALAPALQSSAKVPLPQPADNRRTTLIIILASVAASVLVLAAGGIGWWLLSGDPTPVVALPSPGPGPDKPIDDPPPEPAPPQPGPPTPPTPGPGPGPTPPTPPAPGPGPTPPPPNPPAPPPPTPPSPAGDRQAWLASDSTFVIRQASGRWVEIQDNVEHWFDASVTTKPDYVELVDPRRGVEMRLFADRLELKTPRQDWAVASAGGWAPPNSLPAFANRPLPPARTSPYVPSANAQALVFGGEQIVRIPVPGTLRSGLADWTIEMWLRLDRQQPFGVILASEQAPILSAGQLVGGAEGTAGLAVSWQSANDFPVVMTDRWVHVAVQQRGKDWQLFVDGKPAGSGAAAPERLSADNLVLGAKTGGMSGIVRDFRVSGGQRYASPFTPPLKFEPDAQALVLLSTKAMRRTTIPNLVAGGQDAVREGACWIPLTPERQLAAERTDGSIDLIQAFAVQGDVLEGLHTLKWATKVEAGRAGERTRMLLPFFPSTNYDVSVEITRLEGDGGAFLGLSVAGRPIILVIDAFPELGGRTGILPPDLNQVGSVGFLPDWDPMLQTGSPSRFTIKVRRTDAENFSIVVSRLGARSMTINGKIADVRVPPQFQIPLQRGLSFGSLDARVRFEDFVLFSVSSPSSPGTPVVGAPPVVPKPGAAPGVPHRPAAVARQPVPAEELLAAKRKEAAEIYREDEKQATKPAQKAALARTIFQAGERANTDQTARYVLFDIARIIYIKSGETTAALQTARQIEREFEVPANDTLAATITALEGVPAMAPEQRAALARAAAELANELIAAGQIERADDLATIAVQSAAKQKDADLKKEMQQRKNQVARIVKEHAAVKPHLETLAARPDDPAANLAAGKFHCLTLEDWDRGLTQLALAADGLLSGPAKLDLDAGDDPKKQLAAAEAWLDLVKTNRELDREEEDALKRRARQLLEGPASKLTGLDQVRADKALQPLKSLPPGRAPAKAAPPRAAAAAAKTSEFVTHWIGLAVHTRGPAMGKEFQRVELRFTRKDAESFAADYNWATFADRLLASGKYDVTGSLRGESIDWTSQSNGARGQGELSDGVLRFTWEQPPYFGENWYVPASKANAASYYAGEWDVTEDRGSKFRLSLRADGSAQRSHSPSVPGAWLGTPNRWIIVWRDGWRDLIVLEDGKATKSSFPPGALLTSRPVNTGTIRKVE